MNATQQSLALPQNRPPAGTEIARRANFSKLRYAMVWEDADILMEGLAVKPGDECLSIASAGDNALALLTADPARVVAVDLNPAQLACLELRIAAFRHLTHTELLQLLGSRPATGGTRIACYAKLEPDLPDFAKSFWRRRFKAIRQGVGGSGKFEGYFRLFRRWILPLVHDRPTVSALLQSRDEADREAFYARRWNSWRWRLLFRIFFSRAVMGRLGRDPSFFRYAEGSLVRHLQARVQHALVKLDPAQNPYLHWILTGTHGEVLPMAWREANFDVIRKRLDRIELHCASLEDYLSGHPGARFQRFNLSNLFEYMSVEAYGELLEHLVDAAEPGARLAYWNLRAHRSRPSTLAHRLRPLADEANDLFARDRAFFYSRFALEEVTA